MQHQCSKQICYSSGSQTFLEALEAAAQIYKWQGVCYNGMWYNGIMEVLPPPPKKKIAACSTLYADSMSSTLPKIELQPTGRSQTHCLKTTVLHL